MFMLLVIPATQGVCVKSLLFSQPVKIFLLPVFAPPAIMRVLNVAGVLQADK